MSTLRNFAVHLLLSVSAVGMAGVAHAVPVVVDHVVFGNLGNSGTNALGAGFNEFGPDIDSANLMTALPFKTTTGTTPLELVSVIAGMESGSSVAVTLSIHTVSSGTPTSPALHTSVPVNVSTKSAYTFTFPALYTLTANTEYFVVATAASGSVKWYTQASAPSQRNSSGWTGATTVGAALKYGQVDPPDDLTVDWAQAPSNFQSVSIQAVPEPSTIIPACVGIVGGLAFMGRSCRRRRAASDVVVTEI